GEPPEPYERLLRMALRGDASLYSRMDLLEETWRIVQPLLDDPPEVQPYAKGSWGPPGAERLVEGWPNWREPWMPKDACPVRTPLLPLDGAGGLAGHVEHDAVDLAHLVRDPGRDAFEQVVRQPGPVGGHGVLGGHRPQHDRMPVRPPVALDADGAHVGEQDHRALPDGPIEPG